MTKHEALKKYFGHTAFRPAQETIIDALLCGRDVLGVMPTGAGKSLCYQIPSLIFDGVTFVISPLISLMKDQVAGLKRLNIPAAFINSSLTANQHREVLRRIQSGRYKIVYVAPERLETVDFLRFASLANISFIAVDEAHCVSQWGHDFRPSYLKISDFVDNLKSRPVIGAFTATATADVKRDIIKLLNLQDPVGLTTGFDRPNLYLGVEKPKNKQKLFHELISARSSQCGIIYCSTRKTVDRVCAELRRYGVLASRYHAGLEDIERRVNQDSFISGDINVMVATNAFGMGIDKSDVRYVIHYNMPKNLENYYQEAGRAGRDGHPSECILLFSDKDIDTAEHLIMKHGDDIGISEKEKQHIRRLDERRLDKMIKYCEISSCLRAYILGYFGEKQRDKCGNCSNCKKPGIWQMLKKSINI